MPLPKADIQSAYRARVADRNRKRDAALREIAGYPDSLKAPFNEWTKGHTAAACYAAQIARDALGDGE